MVMGFSAFGRYIPNILTFTRIGAIPPFTVLFFFDTPFAHWVAFGIYAFVSFTDFLDGYLARRWDIQSPLGVMLDPIADKIFVMCTLLSLMVRDNNLIFYIFIPTLIILSRELFISGLREFLSGDSIKLKVTYVAKWKTTLQLLALGVLIVGHAVPYAQIIGLLLLWVAALLTLITGLDYIYKVWSRL